MNPIRQLFGQTAVYGLGIVLPRLLNYLLLTPFYTRVFPREAYGVVTELYAYVVFLLVILTYGMETGFFRYASKKEGRSEDIYASVTGSVFTTSVFFVGLIFLLNRPLSGLLQYQQHPEYLRWLAMIVAIDAFTSIPFARIRLRNQPMKYTLIRIAEVSVNIGLNWFFLYYCPRHATEAEWISLLYDESIGVGYVFISNLAASLVKMTLLLPDILSAFRGSFRWPTLVKILKYAYPLLIAGLAGAINEAIDRVLLKHLLDPAQHPMAQLGVYGANIKIAVLMTLYVQMFRYAAEPFFFSRSSEKEAKGIYADVMKFFLLPGLLIFMVVTLYIDLFVLFIGEDFREGVRIVPVVLLANLMMGILFNLSVWYKLTDKTMIGAKLVLVGAGITVMINMLFVPEFGYIASAWGHLVSYSVMVMLSYFWSRRVYRIPYEIWKLLAYTGVAIGVYATDRLLTVVVPEVINIVKPLLIICALAIFVAGEWKYIQRFREEKTTVNENKNR